MTNVRVQVTPVGEWTAPRSRARVGVTTALIIEDEHGDVTKVFVPGTWIEAVNVSPEGDVIERFVAQGV